MDTRTAHRSVRSEIRRGFLAGVKGTDSWEQASARGHWFRCGWLDGHAVSGFLTPYGIVCHLRVVMGGEISA
jgi:hypothetical protein